MSLSVQLVFEVVGLLVEETFEVPVMNMDEDEDELDSIWMPV